MNPTPNMKTSMTRNKGQVYSVGNYLMNGKVLGKGHFAKVEEATHRIIGKKVSDFISTFISLFLRAKRRIKYLGQSHSKYI